MSNIHGIDGLGAYNAPPGQPSNPGDDLIPSFIAPIYNRGNEDKPLPRDEKLSYTLRSNFCPGLTIRHFVSIISLIDLLMLLVCAICSLIQFGQLNPKVFLGPTDEFFRSLDKDPYQIKYNF